jgi:uncharacterized protein with HEPN domain
MTERDIGYAIDILIACHDIQEFGRQKDSDALAQNPMYQAAILRKLEIIGEVAKRLSIEFKDQHSRINWKGWAGLRDRLIHGYDDINLEIVSNVLSVDVPSLLVELSPYEKENR